MHLMEELYKAMGDYKEKKLFCGIPIKTLSPVNGVDIAELMSAQDKFVNEQIVEGPRIVTIEKKSEEEDGSGLRQMDERQD